VARGGLSLEVDGLVETLAATKALERELERPAANRELRVAGKRCASVLAGELAIAAGASGVPVAPRVARSIRPKSDRIPVVSIGGATRVGARGAPAGVLVWGSEQGPKGDVNHWGVAPSSGYWIAPTVARFASSGALVAYRVAVADVLRRFGLI
jgi:hypothetical protein